MMPLLEVLLAVAQTWFATFFAIFLRVGACFFVLPGLGERMVPVRIRLAAALAMTVLLTPILKDTLAPAGMLPPFEAFVGEAIIGLCIGLALRFVVFALQTAGVIAAQATSLSQIMGGATPDPQPAMGAILSLAGITLVVLSGLHVHLVSAFVNSYTIFPFGEFPRPQGLGAWATERISASFSLAFTLAGPFLVASLLYNVALGVINKAMPQLMVAFVGAPAITMGALLLMMLVTPLALALWSQDLRAVLTAPFSAYP